MMRDMMCVYLFSLVFRTGCVLVIIDIFNFRIEVLLARFDDKPIGCWARVHSIIDLGTNYNISPNMINKNQKKEQNSLQNLKQLR